MKPWYQSKTILGVLVAAVGAALALAGTGRELWGPLVAAGLAAAGFGRAVAQGPLVGRLWAALVATPLAILLAGCSGGLFTYQRVQYETEPAERHVALDEAGYAVPSERSCTVVLPGAFGYGTASGCAAWLSLDPRAAPGDAAGSPTRATGAEEIAGAHGGRLTPEGGRTARGIVPELVQGAVCWATGLWCPGAGGV